MSVDDPEDLEEQGTTLERLLCDLSVTIKHLARSKREKSIPPTISGTAGMSGVQLPRIEVPTFDCNILSWRIFWEQFRQRFELASIIMYLEFQWNPAPPNCLRLPLHSPR